MSIQQIINIPLLYMACELPTHQVVIRFTVSDMNPFLLKWPQIQSESNWLPLLFSGHTLSGMLVLQPQGLPLGQITDDFPLKACTTPPGTIYSHKHEESFQPSSSLTSLCSVSKICVVLTTGSQCPILLGSQEQQQHSVLFWQLLGIP